MLASRSPVTTVTQSSHLSSPGAPYPDTREVISMRPSIIMVTIMTLRETTEQRGGEISSRGEIKLNQISAHLHDTASACRVSCSESVSNSCKIMHYIS